MSSGLLPTEFGDTPTKVVLTGASALSSGQQQVIYSQIAGEVQAFISKARQNRLISGASVSNMQQARPDGGQLRYQYNNGIETVFVGLTAREVAYGRALPPTFPQLPVPPLLAIDVLVRPLQQLVGDINSYRYTTLPGKPDNDGGDPSNQPNFAQFYHRDEAVEYFPDSSFWNYYDKNSGTITVNWGPGIAYLGGSSYTFGPGVPDYDPATEIKGHHPAGTHADATGADWNYIFVYAWQSARSDAGFGPKPNIYLYWDCVAAWSRTAPAGSGQQVRVDQNEKRTYYNMLDVVGAQVQPEGSNDPPYEADSLGMTTDPRLVPIMDGARVVIERKLTIADSAPHPWMGAGFLAKPLKDFVAGQTPPKVPIDIYAAQTNVLQRNTQSSAQPNSLFGVDDVGMTWSMDPLELVFEIQVRELVDVSPYVVQVNLKGEGKVVRTGFSSGNGTTYLATAREQSWRFAATGGWKDTKTDPADPDGVNAEGSPAMGKLLDSTDVTSRTVATITPAPRKILDHVVWTAGIAGMTKIASIVWEPTAEPHQHGKAKITLL